MIDITSRGPSDPELPASLPLTEAMSGLGPYEKSKKFIFGAIRMSKSKKTDAPVVSILNMKGGVGKTTIAAHVFREFYLQKEKTVLLIDLDPQFNLTQTLLKEAAYEKAKLERKTVLSILEDPSSASLYKTSSAASHPPSPGDVATLMKYLRSRDGKVVARLDLLAGDFSLVKYSLMDDKAMLGEAKKRFKEFIEAAKKEYDLICVDCNPSSSFLTTCALCVSSHVLIPVRPDRYSILGLRLLDEFIDGLVGLPAKPKKIIVINGVVTSSYDPTDVPPLSVAGPFRVRG